MGIYNCNYKLREKSVKKFKRIAKSNACYGSFYGKIDEYDECWLYLYKNYDFKKYNQQELDENWEMWTFAEIEEYCNLLKNELGLTFEFCENRFAYIFKIDFTKITIQEAKFQLNLFRYLWESEGPERVKHFLRFAKDTTTDCNLITKLFIAHQNKDSFNHGHTIMASNGHFPLPMSNEQFITNVITKLGNDYCSANFKYCTKIHYGNAVGIKKELQKLINEQEPFEKVYKIYLELCEKYM